MTALQRLESQLSKSVDMDQWTDNDAVAFFTRIRIVLENYEERLNYPTLTLYCDWIVHDGLDRQREPVDRLVEWSVKMAETLADLEATERQVQFFSSGPLLLDLQNLSAQLAYVAERTRAGSWVGVVSQAGFAHLLKLVITEIKNKPVGFCDDIILDDEAKDVPKWQKDALKRLEAIKFAVNLPSDPLFMKMVVRQDDAIGSGPVVLVQNRDLFTKGQDGAGFEIALPIFPETFRPGRSSTPGG